MRVVGMDLHVRNSFLHVTDGQGHLLCRGRVGNTLGELAQFLAGLEHGEQAAEPVRLVMENTTNSRAMHALVQQYGHGAGLELTAQVLNARKLRIIAESVCKCDRLDAAVLNELARSNLKLPVCYVPDDEVFALREHLRARADLVRMRTMLKNRVHAALHRRGILSPCSSLDLFSRRGRQWLAQVTLDPSGRCIVERYLASIDQLEQTIAQSAKSLSELARRQRWCKPAALLRTMPGIGPITSLVILAELGEIDRFRSRAAVSNFAGIVPVKRGSNDKQYSGGITHRGPSHLRGALVEAAWVAVPRVPQYAHLFDRVSQRKGKQVAIVAVARRMLEDAWTMLKRDEVFRADPAVASATSADTAEKRGDRCNASAAPSVAG